MTSEENRERLVTFLKDYEGTLREDMSWLAGAPFSPRAEMAGGNCRVVDRNGATVAVFVTKVPAEDYNPSCPVSARDVQASGILADVLNFLASDTEVPT